MKILYAENVYPQLSESYIAAEVSSMLGLGVRIEVWSAHEPQSKYITPVVPHRAPLQEAIDQFKPDIIHFHFRSPLEPNLPLLAQLNLPVTLRGHSVDYSKPMLGRLLAHPWMRRAYLFPHFAEDYGDDPKVLAVPVGYDPGLYYPEKKDARCVVRTGAGLSYKGLDDVPQIAKLCPSFRFIMIMSTCVFQPESAYLDQLRELNRSLGSPAEILVDLSHEKTASIVRRAGIFLHTHDPKAHPFGMPISTVESMAAGCQLLLRRNPNAASYVAPTSRFYDSIEEAAQLIRDTEGWTSAEWARVRDDAVDHAVQFSDLKVYPAIYWDWCRILHGEQP